MEPGISTRPVGRPPKSGVKVQLFEFPYRAGAWKKRHRVICKIEWHNDELVTLENLTGKLMVDHYALKSGGSRFPPHLHCTNEQIRLILGSGSPKVCTDGASESANSRTNEGARRLTHNSGQIQSMKMQRSKMNIRIIVIEIVKEVDRTVSHEAR
jgi:hypothetical protein